MGLKEMLGFRSGGDPYYVIVTYEDGSIGRFDMWAADGRDAVQQLAKLMPVHVRVAEIRFRLRREKLHDPRA